MKSFEIGTGRTRLTIAWERWGKDLHVHIGGGEHHIGAVALVGCSPDGKNHRHVGDIPPHKEAKIVERAARVLHMETGGNICVTAGIHIEEACKAEIETILRTVDEGIARIVQSLRSADHTDDI